MDWSKIKIIFILTFLVLDLVLLVQFVQKRTNNQWEVMAVTSLDDRLEADKITYSNLPKEPTKESYITGKSREFTEDEVRALKNQSAVLSDSNTIVSRLKEPIVIPKNDKGYFYDEFLRNYVIDGSKYKYWTTNEKDRKIYFFQQYKNQSIFSNKGAAIIADINDKNEIVSYTQTMLTGVTEMGGTQEDIITSAKALETLYLKNEIKAGSKITKVEFGYYTVVIPSSLGVQVIAPTWHFTVNNENDYFVNAMEGQVIKNNKDGTQWSEVK
ncbi:two-component system regulatory protein YycI [Ectobacillus polymachus]|uniref:two-component system regulatory protein YycI n=1 Tax=Ectobacillus polymachus TaxID=1508806 RepID=UPI003A889AFF